MKWYSAFIRVRHFFHNSSINIFVTINDNNPLTYFREKIGDTIDLCLLTNCKIMYSKVPVLINK